MLLHSFHFEELSIRACAQFSIFFIMSHKKVTALFDCFVILTVNVDFYDKKYFEA